MLKQGLARWNADFNAFTFIADAVADTVRDGGLKGVRLAVKDNLMVKGMPMECSSAILKGHVPHENATVVQKLVDAGVAVIGKTNMDEFGMGSFNSHSINGPVVNPRKFLDGHLGPFVAGGSSGGSAAAVAAGLCDLALGSDTGGSIRLPASYCGVLGFKPTYGRISRHGLVAYASSLDTVGLLASDLSLLRETFECVKDDTSGDATAIQRKDGVASFSGRVITVGVPEEMSQGDLTNLHLLVDRLQDSGVSFKKVSLTSLRQALDVYYITSMIEAASCLARYTGQHFGPTPSIIPKDVAFAERIALVRGLGFGEEVQKRLALGKTLAATKWADAAQRVEAMRGAIREDFGEVFTSVDFLLSPTAISGPPPLASVIGSASDEWASDVLTVPASLAGIPAISVPVGPNDTSTSCIGVQLMAAACRDEELLDFAQLVLDTLR